MKSLKVQSEAELTINIVPYESMVQGLVSPEAAAEVRRKALQASALDVRVVDYEEQEEPAADGSPDEGESHE